MKKNFLIILLLSIISYAQTTEIEKYKPQNKHPHEHRGFYTSTSVGIGYLSANLAKTERDTSLSEHFNIEKNVEKNENSGFSYPVFEFKFGTAIANMFVFHTVFNFAAYYGSNDYSYKTEKRNYKTIEVVKETYRGSQTVKELYKDENGNPIFDGDWNTAYQNEESDDALTLNTYVGFGALVYPFRDIHSPLNGFFFGGSVGYNAIAGVKLNHSHSWTGFGKTFELEIGKDWWINDQLSIGVGFTYAHSTLFMEKSKGAENAFALSFRLTRG